jgi:dipeptidyl-peptidase-4
MPMIDSYTCWVKKWFWLPVIQIKFSVILYGRLYNTATKELTKPFDFQVQEPTFFSWWKKIAYAKENNLCIWRGFKSTTQITTDGIKMPW